MTPWPSGLRGPGGDLHRFTFNRRYRVVVNIETFKFA